MGSFFVFLLVAAGIAVYYVYFFKQGGGAGLQQREYGLQPGETVLHVFGGYTVPAPSVGADVAAGVASVLSADTNVHVGVDLPGLLNTHLHELTNSVSIDTLEWISFVDSFVNKKLEE